MAYKQQTRGGALHCELPILDGMRINIPLQPIGCSIASPKTILQPPSLVSCYPGMYIRGLRYGFFFVVGNSHLDAVVLINETRWLVVQLNVNTSRPRMYTVEDKIIKCEPSFTLRVLVQRRNS